MPELPTDLLADLRQGFQQLPDEVQGILAQDVLALGPGLLEAQHGLAELCVVAQLACRPFRVQVSQDCAELSEPDQEVFGHVADMGVGVHLQHALSLHEYPWVEADKVVHPPEAHLALHEAQALTDNGRLHITENVPLGPLQCCGGSRHPTRLFQARSDKPSNHADVELLELQVVVVEKSELRRDVRDKLLPLLRGVLQLVMGRALAHVRELVSDRRHFPCELTQTRPEALGHLHQAPGEVPLCPTHLLQPHEVRHTRRSCSLDACLRLWLFIHFVRMSLPAAWWPLLGAELLTSQPFRHGTFHLSRKLVLLFDNRWHGTSYCAWQLQPAVAELVRQVVVLDLPRLLPQMRQHERDCEVLVPAAPGGAPSRRHVSELREVLRDAV
mmetsp:Transcript_7669/g.19730  ORF Transcript_7669/g.19730 Transcript_7669/m.19730 type:complete len:385 (+) Transcript_7669:1057-2211(+)